MIVYDITDRASFEQVKGWLDEIDKYAQKSVNILLVGNKNDMKQDREVEFEEGK